MNPTMQTRTTVMEARAVSKRYGKEGKGQVGASVTQALDRVSFTVDRGEFVGIMGPSGSGKSTLLNCLATIDVPSSGQIMVNGRDITRLVGRELARFRRDDLGFIFQDANLLDTCTAYENIALALTIQKTPAREIDERVRAVARQLGILDVLEKRPYQMSGGQKQRVAAARATVTCPHLILADEPTGALDSKSARQLMEALSGLHGAGATILMVTHDSFSASFCDRIIFLRDGRLHGELHRAGSDRAQFYRKIVEVVRDMGERDDANLTSEAMSHAC